MAKMGDGKGNTAAETKIHQSSMKVRSPTAADASTRCKGGSVNSEPTRNATAPTPKSLGPREA
jgi:hypothetical protein